MADIEVIRGRLEKITLRPWAVENEYIFSELLSSRDARAFRSDPVARVDRDADREFFLHAPEDIEFLLAENERLNQAIVELGRTERGQSPTGDWAPPSGVRQTWDELGDDNG